MRDLLCNRNGVMRMLYRIKRLIKKALAVVGLYHPSLGIKISSEAKGAMILKYKTPLQKVFVETGTYKGDMIERVGSHFQKIYSIELDDDLYSAAQKRFEGRGDVVLLQGDSAARIKDVLATLHEPAFFWLDAHGSGGLTIKNPLHCPVEKELEEIFAHGGNEHIVLIDDARQFDRFSISKIKSLAKTNGYRFAIREGLFILH